VSQTEGTVLYNGRPICDDHWSNDCAQVVCRMLGFNNTGARATNSAYHGKAGNDFIMDDVRCNGDETDLAHCQHRYNSHNCGAGEAAGVVCQEPDYSEDKIELLGGSTEFEGNVMLNSKPICDDKWSNAAARVVCRMLGLNPIGAVATTGSKFGEMGHVFAMDDVVCEGNELNIRACNYRHIDNCGASEAAGVICGTSGPSQVTLVGGSHPGEGNVIINGRPVCDDLWDKRDADVVCRMIGFVSGQAVTNSAFGQVELPFIMDDVQCEGHESDILACHHASQHNCGVHEGAGVRCQQMMLLSDHEGRVFIEGNVICPDEWDDAEAHVVCRMLGYTNGNSVTLPHLSTTSHHISNVNCSGEETSLALCPQTFLSAGSSCINDLLDAGVTCFNP